MKAVKGLFRLMKRILNPIPKRYRAFTLIIAVPVLLIIGSFGVYQLLHPLGVKASWFDESWLYRKAITITVTSSAADISNLETLVSVDTSTSGKFQSSCQDLRFTNVNGKQLPYYIDSGCGTATTKVWVMVDLVPKNTTTYTMYMYYGNSSAQAESDSAKFRLFNGLVGYWTMNEGSWNGTAGEVKDSSIDANNGQASGNATTTSSGKYSYGGTFDGTGDYVEMSDMASTENINTLTVSAWVYSDPSTNYRTVLSKGNYTRGSWEFRMTRDSDGPNLSFSVVTAGGRVGSTIAGFGNSAWHHVTGVYDGSKTYVYLDGVLVDSDIQTGNIVDTSNTVKIGTNGNSPTGESWDGKIDDVRIYNRALAADEITQLYSNPGNIASYATTISKPTTAAAAEEAGPGPVGYWKFDDGQGQTAQDSSSSNLDGTLNNTPTWTKEDQCISGKCLYFDGTNNENVSRADDSKLDFGTGSFSASAWVKRNGASSANNVILTKSTANIGSTYTGYKVYMDASGDLCFDTQDGTNAVDTACTSAVDFDDNKWHYVTGVKITTTSLTLYVDGNSRATDSSIASTATLSNASTFYIGVDSDGTTTEWLGFIDEPKIYPYARTAAQVKTDYLAGKAAAAAHSGTSAVLGSQPQDWLSNGLVGYWKMDETSWSGTSADILDASGNSNNGTAACGVVDCSKPIGGAAGKFGNGGDFDGTDDAVTIPDSTSLRFVNASGISVSAWVKVDSYASKGRDIVNKMSGKNGFQLRNTTSGTFQWGVGNGTSNPNVTGGSITTGTWYHVVGTFDKTTYKLFVNGTQVSSGSLTGFADDTAQLVIGHENQLSNSSEFDGIIDETRIYNRAFSPKEVSDLYNWAPGPVVRLNMDEGTGTSANDTSGQGRTGTVNNGTWTVGKYGKGVQINGTSGSNVSVPDFGY